MVQSPLFRLIFAFNLEIKVWSLEEEWRGTNPSCMTSNVNFLKSVMIWGAVTSAGVGPLCFVKSKVNSAVYQEILEHFMLPSADKLYGDADFLSSRTLAPDLTAKTTSKCFNDHDITVLDWPDNMPDLNPICNLWDIFKRKIRNSRSNNTDELKAVPQAAALESSVTGWSLPCHTSLMLESVAKGAPTKYWVHKWTYLKEIKLLCLANFYFFYFRKYSTILR